MCEGFGLIVSKTLDCYFIEPDSDGDVSHSDILSRLGWKENGDQHIRNFVRVEYPNWQPSSFHFDEDGTLPGWCENNMDEIHNKCDKILSMCAPAWAEYMRVREVAWAEYWRMCNVTWAKLIAIFPTIKGYVPKGE